MASCSLCVHAYGVHVAETRWQKNEDSERKVEGKKNLKNNRYGGSKETLCCAACVMLQLWWLFVLCSVYVCIMSHQWLAKLMWSAVEAEGTLYSECISGKEEEKRRRGVRGSAAEEHIIPPIVGVNYTKIHKTHRSRAQKPPWQGAWRKKRTR